MTHLALALPLAALLPIAQPETDHFVVTITTVHGKTIEGIVLDTDARFQAVTLTGKTLDLRLEKLPPYTKRELSETITRLDAGFLLQAPSYTAVVKSIWAELPVRVGDQVVRVAGDQVRTATVKFVRPEKAAPK